MNPKILAICYSQSGQLASIIDNLCLPLAGAGCVVHTVDIAPREAYPFPWTTDTFFKVMPPAVLGTVVPLRPFTIPDTAYDLVIVGYQAWFLSPCIVTRSLLEDETIQHILRNTPVITVTGARNMWTQAFLKLQPLFSKAGARLVGNIALVDRHPNLISIFTIFHWMRTGQKTRLLGFFPRPGVSNQDIANARALGGIVAQHLQACNWKGLQPKLAAKGRLPLPFHLMFIESKAAVMFSLWAKKINRSRHPQLWLLAFRYYLFAALFLLAPLVWLTDLIIFKPFFFAIPTGKKSHFFHSINPVIMSNRDVYISKTAIYMPGEPIPSEAMEDYLGLINGKPSKSRKIVLRNNGIQTRYYALDTAGKATHTNAQMTSLAVKALFEDDAAGLKEVQLLSAGTSSPDQLMPSHGVMTHGWLPETGAIEVVSPSGVCCAGMHAFKYAWLAVKSGDVSTAVAAGSERFSGSLVANVFDEEAQQLKALRENPFISFDKEFLRWMLSDGAAAFLLTDTPNRDGLSLRVDWIEGVSYANEMKTCMYMGAEKQPDGSLKGFMDFSSEEIKNKSILSIKQDIGLLSDNIVRLGGEKIKKIFESKGLDVGDIDYFLPHMSSEFFRTKITDIMNVFGKYVPPEKWFVNLATMGNVGAASVYLMVNELFRSGRLKKGERLLLLVPESARFSYMYAMLTVC